MAKNNNWLDEREHEHKYFFSQNKKEFIEVPYDEFEQGGLYRMYEVAYLVCNCTKVLKVPVEDKTNGND